MRPARDVGYSWRLIGAGQVVNRINLCESNPRGFFERTVTAHISRVTFFTPDDSLPFCCEPVFAQVFRNARKRFSTVPDAHEKQPFVGVMERGKMTVLCLRPGATV